jgi:hypothetical protein
MRAPKAVTPPLGKKDERVQNLLKTMMMRSRNGLTCRPEGRREKGKGLSSFTLHVEMPKRSLIESRNARLT